MSHKLTISELRAIVLDLADRYPRARVDFVYPKRHGNKFRSQLGYMTQYSLLRSGPGMEIVRIVLDHARGQDADGEAS